MTSPEYGLVYFFQKGLAMKTSDNAFIQWIFPLLFIACAGWIIWHGATYIMAFGGYTDALAARYRQIFFRLRRSSWPASLLNIWYLYRKASGNGVGGLLFNRSNCDVCR